MRSTISGSDTVTSLRKELSKVEAVDTSILAPSFIAKLSRVSSSRTRFPSSEKYRLGLLLPIRLAYSSVTRLSLVLGLTLNSTISRS